MFFTSRKRIASQDLKTKDGSSLYDGVSPLIYDLGENNSIGLNLTRGGIWLDSREFRNTMDSLAKPKRMAVWPANDLTHGLTYALEFQHTATMTGEYETQWDDNENHDDWVASSPAYPLLYRNWPDYATLEGGQVPLLSTKAGSPGHVVRKKDPDYIAGYRTNIDWMVSISE